MREVILRPPDMEAGVLFPKCRICGGNWRQCPGSRVITVMTDPDEYKELPSGTPLPEGFVYTMKRKKYAFAVKAGITTAGAGFMVRAKAHLPLHLRDKAQVFFVGGYKYALYIPKN